MAHLPGWSIVESWAGAVVCSALALFCRRTSLDPDRVRLFRRSSNIGILFKNCDPVIKMRASRLVLGDDDVYETPLRNMVNVVAVAPVRGLSTRPDCIQNDLLVRHAEGNHEPEIEAF